MYQVIFINVHTVLNTTLKHYYILPLSRIYDSALLMCKGHSVSSPLVWSLLTKNGSTPGESESNQLLHVN